MSFPIHGFPSDYWRFTPEAFRTLCKGFGFTAVFFSGDPAFPHSVCIVGGFGRELAARTREVVEKAKRLDVHAPPHFDRLSGGLAHYFSERLVADVEDPLVPSESPEGGLEIPFRRRGWVLTRGSWVKGWIRRPEASFVEIRVGGNRIYRGVPDIRRPDIDSSLGLPLGTAKGFRGQVQFVSDHGDAIGKAELWGADSEGVEFLAAQSAPGVAVPRPFVDPGFILHSFDEHHESSEMLDRGRRLVAEIRNRGDMVRVDLGCGFRKQGNIGIDMKSRSTQADLICHLGFEPIPLDDRTVMEITARDFLEHLPKAVYLERERRMHYPVIYLMNEVWRVLEEGGTFISWTPCYPKEEIHQDPTHLSVWTSKSMDYFCGKFPIAKRYGVEADFELLENRMEGFYLYSRLRKKKADQHGV
jgi:hypothetical protein